MITGSSSCFPNGQQELPIYGVAHEDVVSSSVQLSCTAAMYTQSTSFLYNLSVLRDKVQQMQSLAGIFISSDNNQPSESTAMAVATIGTLIQEIIVTASSMMFTCQQLALGVGSTSGNNNGTDELHPSRVKLPVACPLPQQNRAGHYGEEREQGFQSNGIIDNWYADNSYNNMNNNNNTRNSTVAISIPSEVLGTRDPQILPQKFDPQEELEQLSPKNYDIVELDAADLLAKYTHYCQVCGKGFKRDANLRMHMRAHGDEYKSSAALSNPLKKNGKDDQEGLPKLPRKYSCPQEGCRWNRKHVKFQPLKSMTCVKNHYKRSHCPKMYVCKRCNRKQFSVLSDLRTHEKHCGDLRWQCSCGTTFSRKDKLMGHVALFVGHSPAISSLAKMRKSDRAAVEQVQLET